MFRALRGRYRKGFFAMARNAFSGLLGAALLSTATLLGASAAAYAQEPSANPVENFFTAVPGGSTTPPPQAFGGARCQEIVPKVGPNRVIWGRFAGGRIRSGRGRHDRMDNYQADGCFPTMAACEAWMYALKSKWGDNPKYNDCSPGYEPGRPVRWVFGPQGNY